MVFSASLATWAIWYPEWPSLSYTSDMSVASHTLHAHSLWYMITLSFIFPLLSEPTMLTSHPACRSCWRNTLRYPFRSADVSPVVIEAPRGMIRKGNGLPSRASSCWVAWESLWWSWWWTWCEGWAKESLKSTKQTMNIFIIRLRRNPVSMMSTEKSTLH